MTSFAAVCTAYHEADIIYQSVMHMWEMGASRVLVKCREDDEETIYWAKQLNAEVIAGPEEFHDQPRDIDMMAALSACDWIVPFDADEFIYPTDPTLTIAQYLEGLSEDVNIVHIAMFQHHDWWWREPLPKPLPKVAYRWSDSAHVTPGNHSVTMKHPGRSVDGLHLREIQYRGFEHFCRKIAERNATIDPSFSDEFGWHHKRYRDASDAKLAEVWRKYEARPLIWDPIPSPVTPDYDGPKLTVDELFDDMANRDHDIAGHMERLKEIASHAKFILELGVNTGMSTIAFLTGLPIVQGAIRTHIISCDIAPPRVRPEVSLDSRWNLEITNDLNLINYPFVAPMEVGGGFWYLYDVVFIDTSHTYRQTLAELEMFWPWIGEGGCLILHDTVSCPDVLRAVRHFLHTLDQRPRIEAYEHSCGLMILWKEGE